MEFYMLLLRCRTNFTGFISLTLLLNVWKHNEVLDKCLSRTIALDISMAVDMVQHKELLHMPSSYGTTERVFSFSKSFPTSRSLEEVLSVIYITTRFSVQLFFYFTLIIYLRVQFLRFFVDMYADYTRAQVRCRVVRTFRHQDPCSFVKKVTS